MVRYTEARRKSRLIAPLLTAGALVLLMSPAARAEPHADGNIRLYGERAAMSLAGQRCHLFTPNLAQALAMGELQARNSALRAGAPRSAVSDILQTAQARAATIACNDPLLLSEAGKVRRAFAAYSHVLRMTFQGTVSAWKADRASLSTRVETGRWALTTTPVRSPPGVRLGAVGYDGQSYLFAASPPGSAAPSSARLVLRDPERADSPYLAGHLTPAPRDMSRVYFATERHPAPDGGTGFRFSNAAIAALSALDPREALIVEFVYPGRNGDQVTQSVFEVGDFGPAINFLKMGQ